MNDQTIRLLEKALAVSPEDWETRAGLLEALLTAGRAERALEILRAAPMVPDDEPAGLLEAEVELAAGIPADALATLDALLARNRACARAYLLSARACRALDRRDDARRKYGAATLIDESLADPELARWIESDAAPATEPAPELSPEDEAMLASISGGDDAGATEETTPASNRAPVSPDLSRRITFADVGGMDEVIERVRMNIIYPFKNPEVFRKFNRAAGGGILMYGPPGCGKTHLARATAGECNATFMSVAITDILSKWIGESERHLHDIFENARAHSPAVLFIDEIDAIGMNRSDAGSYQAPIVNVLLTEMDGIRARNENLMVLAATNVPWRVDSALRRPGRFDRVLFVPPPDAGARKAILDIHLRGLPLAKGLDVGKLAKGAERYSGADLRAVVERASERAIYQEMRTGKSSDLTQAMLAEALKETKPSTAEWLETARSYATYANKTGLYDDLVAYFER